MGGAPSPYQAPRGGEGEGSRRGGSPIPPPWIRLWGGDPPTQDDRGGYPPPHTPPPHTYWYISLLYWRWRVQVGGNVGGRNPPCFRRGCAETTE